MICWVSLGITHHSLWIINIYKPYTLELNIDTENDHGLEGQFLSNVAISLIYVKFRGSTTYKSQPVRITVTPICSLKAKIKKHLRKKEKTATHFLGWQAINTIPKKKQNFNMSIFHMSTLKKGYKFLKAKKAIEKLSSFQPSFCPFVFGLELLPVGISLRILDPDLLLSQQKLMAIHPSHEKSH